MKNNVLIEKDRYTPNNELNYSRFHNKDMK